MRSEHLLNTGDVGQLRGSATVVEGAEVLVAGQALAHLQNFDVAVLQLPDLSLGEDQGSVFASQFHSLGAGADARESRWILTESTPQANNQFRLFDTILARMFKSGRKLHGTEVKLLKFRTIGMPDRNRVLRFRIHTSSSRK